MVGVTVPEINGYLRELRHCGVRGDHTGKLDRAKEAVYAGGGARGHKARCRAHPAATRSTSTRSAPGLGSGSASVARLHMPNRCRGFARPQGIGCVSDVAFPRPARRDRSSERTTQNPSMTGRRGKPVVIVAVTETEGELRAKAAMPGCNETSTRRTTTPRHAAAY